MKISYSFTDFIYNVLWPFKWLKLKWCKWWCNLNKRYQVYSNGQRKLNKELGVVVFIKMQLKIKIILRLILSKHQRLLASYSKINKINVSSSSSDSHSGSSSDQKIPKMLDINITKQEHTEIVGKFINHYLQQDLTFNDHKLLYWVFSNNEIDQKFKRIKIFGLIAVNCNLKKIIDDTFLSPNLVSKSQNRIIIPSAKLLDNFKNKNDILQPHRWVCLNLCKRSTKSSFMLWWNKYSKCLKFLLNHKDFINSISLF